MSAMMKFTIVSSLALMAFVQSALGATCSSEVSPVKQLVCFFEGKRPVSDLNPCLCTHLIYDNFGIDEHARVKVGSDAISDLKWLREANPDLKILISLGGSKMSADEFSSLISSSEDMDSLTNLTTSVAELFRDDVIDGVEIDWEWPTKSGASRDKIELVKMIKQLKLTAAEELVLSREERDAEDGDAEGEDDQGATTTTESSETSTNSSSSEESSDNTTPPMTTPETSDPSVESNDTKEISSEDDGKLDELQTLIDLFLDEQEKKDEDEEEFIVFLRLAPSPEQLVKGYDFKMLNRFVDFYTLPTYNLSQSSWNATFHHSRLMGVSDIENADSLIDIVLSLGAKESKLILSGTAFGNSFELLDSNKTLPGSAARGVHPITYQQVCKTLKDGNWTLEREEDKTGPYAFNDNSWLAFDDDTSVRIKAKYALLRNLGGIGLFSVDADDIDNECGKGSHSLIATIHQTLTALDRKPRQLIVHSLEEDLYAQAQTFVPVQAAQGLNVSPFRIVRIVDQEGRITSIRENSETVLECTRQGYYRHPQDCTRFYRCVKFNQYENDYTIFEYACPNGLVFDDRWEVCVWPAQASPCDGSSEIQPVPRNDYSCPSEGYFVDPENCRWFFACLDHKGDGTYTHYEFRCPFGLAFDEEYLICNWPWLVPACGGTRGANILPHRARQQKAFGGFGRGRGGQQALGRLRGGRGRYAGASNTNPAPHSNGAFKSHLPARQSTQNPYNRIRVTTPAYETTASYTTKRPSYPAPGTVYGEIASDNCDNCESGVLFVRGNGHRTNSGIEVAQGNRYDQEPRQPKNNNAFSSGYNQNAYDEPNYQQNRYPSNSHSAPNGLGAQYNPSSVYGSSTPRPVPSTTYAPSTTTSQDYGQPSSTQGYNYPVPESPLEYPERKPSAGISVSNPGENGLKPGSYTPNQPSSTYNPSTTPNTTPYSPSTYNPSTPAPQPSYQPSSYRPTYDPSTTARPVYQSSTTQRPKYPSTTSRPNYQFSTSRPTYPSTTQRPAYPSSTYRPVYQSTTKRPSYPSTTSKRPSYEKEPTYEDSSNSGYSYPVPENPLELPERKPSHQEPSYQSTRRPTYRPTTPKPTYRPTTPRPTYRPTTPRPTYRPTTPRPTYSSTLQSTYSTHRAPAYPTTPAYGSSPAYVPDYSQGNYGQPSYRPSYQSTTYQPAYPSTTARPAYQSSSRPAYQSTTKAPAYPSTTKAPAYPSTTRAPAYPSTTRRPSYSTTQRPSYKQEENGDGYVYKVPDNPLVLPERKPKAQSGFSSDSNDNSYQQPDSFRAPEIEYGGFKPPYIPDEPRSRPNYQKPSYNENVSPSSIEYGFRPSYSNDQDRPNYPYHEKEVMQAPRQPKFQQNYQEPYKPDYSDQADKGYVSSITTAIYDFVSTTIAPYVPAFTTPRPSPAPRQPENNYNRPQSPGYPGSRAEVASVIPSGFTSATLSNGPNSLPNNQYNNRAPSNNYNQNNPSYNANYNRPDGNNNNYNRPSYEEEDKRPSYNNRPSSPGYGKTGSYNRPASPKENNSYQPSRPYGQNGPQRPSYTNNGSNRPSRPTPDYNRKPTQNTYPQRPSPAQQKPSAAHQNINLGNNYNERPAPKNPNNNYNNNRPSGGHANINLGPSSSNRYNRPSGGHNGNLGNGNNHRNNRPTYNANGSNSKPSYAPHGQQPRGGRQHGQQGPPRGSVRPGGFTAVSRPIQKQPALLSKFQGSNWDKFGPGGYRNFNETLGPEVCDRPGLFRHPTDCDKFYECYWDKWIERYTLHVFPCPIVLGFDSGITACNWPFDGPQCQANLK